MRVVNRTYQRLASAFPEGEWYLDTPLFQGLVAYTVFEDKPGMRNGTTKKEVSRGKSHGVEMFFKEIGAIFFPPSSPPKRAERNGRNNCRQAGTIVDAGQSIIFRADGGSRFNAGTEY
jgi:hypothetical protein